jgi:long-subunit acyl-CoA synthetase (AMP-forming)
MGTSTAESGTAMERPEALDVGTLCEAFQITVAQRSDELALKAAGGDTEITWGEYAERVRNVAAGLSALGVSRGDTVALMLTNRPEFNVVDAGAFHLGATPFSVYNTSSPEQIEYLFSNADNTVVICEAQFLPIIKGAEAPQVKHIVVLDGEASGDNEMTLAELEAGGEDGFDFDAAWRAVEPDDVLTLIYTSGTTGPPKGVEITHRNMMEQCRAVASTLPMSTGGRQLSYLPSAHIADRWLTHYNAGIVHGATIYSVADPRQVVAALPEARPTVWGAVPRIWEKIKAALEAQGVTDPSALPAEAKAGIHAKLGLDQVEWLISGAAPIPAEVLEYFLALDMPICELWGMSELSCCAVVNPPDDIRIGTVGKALPGVELKLLEDGELLVRGPIVMKGYRKQPDKTAEAVDSDGWMHTGDIATIDDDGYVKIVDRKKELIINAAGKNMSPANIEQKIKASSPLIGQVACIGDARAYNTALIVLDPDACAVFAKEHGLDDASAEALCQNADVQAEVARGVDAANERMSRVEQIKRFTVLPTDWEPGGDELTPTMKLKRKPIAAKYEDEIEGLYTGP